MNRTSYPDRIKLASHRCTGVILNDIHVLTSASCLHNSKGQLLPLSEIRIGVGNSLIETFDQERIQAAAVYPHKGFKHSINSRKQWKARNDLAIIRLVTPLSQNWDWAPACLDTRQPLSTNKLSLREFSGYWYPGQEEDKIERNGKVVIKKLKEMRDLCFECVLTNTLVCAMPKGCSESQVNGCCPGNSGGALFERQNGEV